MHRDGEWYRSIKFEGLMIRGQTHVRSDVRGMTLGGESQDKC